MRAGAPAKAQRIDTQHGDVRIHIVTPVAGGFEFARQRFAHNHPERVASGDAVAARQHEFIAVGMLGTPIVVTQAAEIRTRQVYRDVVGRVG